MLTKAQIKFIRSLHQKKFRQEHRQFLVEGDKTVRELLRSNWKIEMLYATNTWLANNAPNAANAIAVSNTELTQISSQQQPDEVVAVVQQPLKKICSILEDKLYLLCDTLNDPGNAGSILRIADWFGLGGVIFSEGSVEIYNPKAVAAAKGSLFRVNIHYTALPALLAQYPHLPIIGTFMQGENLYSASLPTHGFIVIGNEANGISNEVSAHIHKRVTIPRYGHAESLNVAVAAGVIVSELVRRKC